MVNLTRYKQEVVATCLANNNFELVIAMMKEINVALLTTSIYAKETKHKSAKKLATACDSTSELINNLNKDCVKSLNTRSGLWTMSRINSLLGPITKGINLCIKLHREISASDSSLETHIEIFPEDLLFVFTKLFCDDKYGLAEKELQLRTKNIVELREKAKKIDTNDGQMLVSTLTQFGDFLHFEVMNNARDGYGGYRKCSPEGKAHITRTIVQYVLAIRELSMRVLRHA
jgi:hypothetical protein